MADSDTTDEQDPVVDEETARELLNDDDSDLSDAVREELTDLLDERGGESEERGVAPDTTNAEVTLDEKERGLYRDFHTLKMMEANADQKREAASTHMKALIKGGHFGERAVHYLNNGADPADAALTARRESKNELAKRMYRDVDGLRYESPSQRAAGDFYSTVVDADGGNLLPEEVVNEIEEIAEESGVIQGISRTFNHIVGTLTVPAATGADTPMNFVDEGGEITARKRAFQKVSLNPGKLADILPWTYEIQLEAASQILNDIERVMGRNYGKAIDAAALQGDGSSSFNGITGLFNRTAVSEYTIGGSTEFTDISPDDIKRAAGGVPPSLRGGATFVFHPDMRDLVFELFKDDSGDYIFDYNSREGAADQIGGYDVVYTEELPTFQDLSAADQADSVFGVVGNFDYLKVALGEGITTERATQGIVTDADDGSNINLFTQDLRALKYRAFMDLDLNFPEAFNLISTAA
jgi:HK97 family phage major capsid protein